MTIFIAFLGRNETLEKLMINASIKGWLLNHKNLDLPTKIGSVEDARRLIKAYGNYHIERSLGVDLSGTYFESYGYDLKFGSAYEVLHPELRAELREKLS
mgnify:FL=1